MNGVSMHAVYMPSADVVAREIEGEVILVPLIAGIGEEDELFSMNESGKVIWHRLDGHKTLADVTHELAAEFDLPVDEMAVDVQGFLGELVGRRIVEQVA